jgi:hypothetical protein
MSEDVGAAVQDGGGASVAQAATKLLKDSGRLLLKGVKAALGEPITEADAVLEDWRRGSATIERRPARLGEVVTRCMARASGLCGQRGLDLLLDRGDAVPSMELDERRIEAAIDAMLTVGLAAFSDVSTVRLRTVCDPTGVHVALTADHQTPAGMLQAELLRDGSALSIARAIAVAHGGELSIHEGDVVDLRFDLPL